MFKTFQISILCLLAAFALYAGLFGVTGFREEAGMVWMSDSRPGWDGFLYTGNVMSDPMRIACTVPFHLGYLTSRLLRMDGSFLGYEIVYLALWVGRGVLLYLLVTRWLAPGQDVMGALCALFGTLSASDKLMVKIAMLHHQAAPTWAIAGLVCLCASWTSASWIWRIVWALMAAGFCILACYTYEAVILLVAGAPLVLMLRIRPHWTALWTLLLWYGVMAVYTFQTISRYLVARGAAGGSYQNSTVRFGGIGSYLEIFFNQVYRLFAFWDWRKPAYDYPPFAACVACGVAALLFLAFLLFIWSRSAAAEGYAQPSSSDAEAPTAEQAHRDRLVTLGLGIFVVLSVLCITSMVNGATAFFRTQLLAGPGFGLAAGAGVMIIAEAVRARAGLIAAHAMILVAAGAVIAGGIAATTARQVIFAAQWKMTREAMWQVVNVVPTVKDRTIVMLILPEARYPQDTNPFADLDIWFDFPIRSAYIDVSAAGVLAFRQPDGSIKPIRDWKVDQGNLVFIGKNIRPAFESAAPDQIIVLEMDGQDRIRMLDKLPEQLGFSAADAAKYNPRERIPVPDIIARNRRRFGYPTFLSRLSKALAPIVPEGPQKLQPAAAATSK